MVASYRRPDSRSSVAVGRVSVLHAYQWRSHTSGVRGVRTPCQENTFFFGMRFLSVIGLRVKPSGMIYHNVSSAMLCIRGTRHGPVSDCVCLCLCLCLSVTSRCSTKTAKQRITQTAPHDTPGTLVFCCQISPLNSTGVTPYGGAKCRWGG